MLLLLAITAATTTLTLGLALHGVTSQPYQQTRAATAGPDVVAQLPAPAGRRAAGTTGPRSQALAHAPGVTGHSGPYPVASAVLRARGITAAGEAEGRDQAPAPVDQPKLTPGSWVRSGGVVVERTFADALGVGAGDRVTLNGRPFTGGRDRGHRRRPAVPESSAIDRLRFRYRPTAACSATEPRPDLAHPGRCPEPGYAARQPLCLLPEPEASDPASAQAFATLTHNPAAGAPT